VRPRRIRTSCPSMSLSPPGRSLSGAVIRILPSQTGCRRQGIPFPTTRVCLPPCPSGA
jgi:hypothetical protein